MAVSKAQKQEYLNRQVEILKKMVELRDLARVATQQYNSLQIANELSEDAVTGDFVDTVHAHKTTAMVVSAQVSIAAFETYFNAGHDDNMWAIGTGNMVKRS